jgi:glutamate-5-semialdehyde dehydrogenase
VVTADPVDAILDTAREATRASAPVGAAAYADLCDRLGTGLCDRWADVIAANDHDIDATRQRGLPEALVERVRLTDKHLHRLDALTRDVRSAVGGLVDPSWRVVGDMRMRRVPRPIGVVLFVYEARPTVTVEGALLAACAGNAVLLRGGREIRATNLALGDVITGALTAAGLPPGLVQVLDDGDRAQLRAMLGRRDAIDLLIPRGSPSLIEHCLTRSTIPVIASGGGVNHLYVHHSADPVVAAAIAVDSKMTVPTACNTLEMVLADTAVAPAVVAALSSAGAAEPYTLKVSEELMVEGAGAVRVEALGPHDDGREFLDRTLAVRAVGGLADAVAHIRRFGSAHTEGIVAEDQAAVREFCARVDAAAVVVNGSLRLHDGPTMRLGPELSISTGRLHVRGPVTIGAMLTYSWVIEGNGTLRDRLDGADRRDGPARIVGVGAVPA